ncbi:MAG: hypothetical protein ABMA02_05690 [Saprospiraceae bacterium]|jgi:hypothetical protein
MKSIRDIVIVAAVAIGLLLLIVYLFRPGKSAADAGGNKGGEPDGDQPPGALPCQSIPENLPPFQNAVTPPGAKAYLNVPDADWTSDFEARLRGFFLAVDVEPSDFTMKYFGAAIIWQYLNSPEGQLSDLLTLKASKRCGTIVGVPSQDVPKPAFCLSFTSGNWLEPTYQDGKDAHNDGIRQVFGIPKSEWTPAMQSRIKGFFKAIDIEPSVWNAKGLNQWYHRQPAKEYLASALGGLPDTLITKGCMRCDGKSDQFINDL